MTVMDHSKVSQTAGKQSVFDWVAVVASATPVVLLILAKLL